MRGERVHRVRVARPPTARRSSCSASGRGRSTRRSLRTVISMRWSRSASVSTASRWRSSSPRHGCDHCRSRSCWSACRTGSACCVAAAAAPSIGTRHCGPRCRGRTSCSPTTNACFFDRASVFAGGFDLRAAETVCGFDPIDDVDVVDLVSSLVDKSMIVADRGAVGMRYRLLETLRQYGEDQLELRGETALLRDRHAAHYADLIGELDLLVRGRAPDRGRGSGCRSNGTTCAPRTCGHWRKVTSTSPNGSPKAATNTPSSACVTNTPRCWSAPCNSATSTAGRRRHMLGMLSYWMDMQGNGAEIATLRPARPRRCTLARPSHHRDLLVGVRRRLGRGHREIAGGAGRLPTSCRGGRQHPRSRHRLVGADLPDRRLAERRSHLRRLRCDNS